MQRNARLFWCLCKLTTSCSYTYTNKMNSFFSRERGPRNLFLIKQETIRNRKTLCQWPVNTQYFNFSLLTFKNNRTSFQFEEYSISKYDVPSFSYVLVFYCLYDSVWNTIPCLLNYMWPHCISKVRFTERIRRTC